MKLLSEIDKEISALGESHERARRDLDAAKEAFREQTRAYRARVKTLERAKALLSSEPGTRPAADKAGRKAKEKVRGLIASEGVITQAKLTEIAGLNSGSVAYAVKSLERAGVIRDTGNRVGRSREYEYVGQRS